MTNANSEPSTAEGVMNDASELLLVDGQIIIGGSYWRGEPHYEASGESNFVMIVGTPLGG